jgi:hypothetical protein
VCGVDRLRRLENLLRFLIRSVKKKNNNKKKSSVRSSTPNKTTADGGLLQNHPTVTHPLRFFQREKNASEFISVGSKNLFIVSGSFKLSRCCTLLYKKRIVSVA